MSVSVVVPLRPGDEVRDANWNAVRAQYPEEWQLTVAGDGQTGEFCKGAAVARCCALSRGRVLVIADSDLFIGRAAIVAAVRAVEAGAPWVVPYCEVYRLGNAQSEQCRRGRIPSLPGRVGGRHHPAVVGGGIVVCTRDGYDAVGGIDPRFTGWGGEDISFGRALDTLVGRHVMLPGVAWHLWHKPMRRQRDGRASAENESLANQYLDAHDNPDAMRALSCR